LQAASLGKFSVQARKSVSLSVAAWDIELKILVTFALENEFAPWRAMHDFHNGTWGAANAQFAEIGGAEVGVVLTGAGPKNAACAAAKVLRDEHESVNICISSGLAGGLRPDYRIGQVLAAETLFSENLRDKEERQMLESSAALLSFAAESGAALVGQFFSANHVVASAEEKRLLGMKADAVEMESFEIVREGRAYGVPAVAIRSISDTFNEDLPIDMSEILTEEGQVSIPRVLGQVARRPQSLPGLMRLGQNSKRAAESLAQFLDLYVARVAEKTLPLETRAYVAGN
jgi:adenosylhomocysteine nucleosidase